MAPKSDKAKKATGKTITDSHKASAKKNSSKPKKREEEDDDDDELDEDLEEATPAKGKAVSSKKKMTGIK